MATALCVISALLMASCGVGGGGAAAGTDALKVGTLGEPDSLDPAAGTGGQSYPFLYSIYDRLMNLNPKDGKVEAGLAISWGFHGADQLQFDITLRDGVKFQDGTPLDAQAVVDSITHYKTVGHQHDMDVVKSVNATGPLTVSMQLAEPFSALPAALADRAGMIVSPTALQKYGTELSRHPIGAGPFSFDSWATGTDVQLSRFDGYWQQGTPKLSAINYRIYPSSTAMTTALTTGQIDYAYGIDPRDLPVLRSAKNLTVEPQPSLQFYDLALNNAKAPTDNVYLRRAMNLAIDRDALNEAVLGGVGEPAYLPVPSSSYASSSIPSELVPRYDPEKAKHLLAEAGFGSGVTVPVCFDAQSNGGTQMFSLMQEQMSRAGITLEPTVTSGVNCNDQFVSKKTIPVYMKAWSGRPDPYLTYSQNFGSNGLYNVGGEPNEGMDEVLTNIAIATTQEEQEPLYDKLNALFLESVPYIITLYVPNVTAYSDKVANDIPNFQGKTNLVSLSFKN